MSLFRDSMRPPPLASDAAVRRYLELIHAEIEADPFFRRRLRGVVLNQFVAAREGTAPATRKAPRAMGRLGRACLYASVAVTLSLGVTMAASQSAVPGDPLYAVKLRIEELRVVALPAELRDDLAVNALTERINELSRLTQDGDVERAEALIAVIEDQVAVVAAMELSPGLEDGLLASRLEVLETLIERLPPRAQQAIEQALAGTPGLVKAGPGPAIGDEQDSSASADDAPVPAVAGPVVTDEADANGPQGDGSGNGGSRNGGTSPPGQADEPSTTPEAIATPRPTPSPKPRDGGRNADPEGKISD
jgi:uncharacterized protein DUF5667